MTRPAAKDFVPQPIDQEIRKNPEGKVTFNLSGQPWGVVLQWLADASVLSLDWQELPGDFLNLTTTRSYTLPEARDLINRHLLARAYSILLNGEMMTIVKVKDLNASLVPRVKPEELETLSDHTLCRISFDLDWLIADEAVEELKPMLSSAGQIATSDDPEALAELEEILGQLSKSRSNYKVFRLKHSTASWITLTLKDYFKADEQTKSSLEYHPWYGLIPSEKKVKGNHSLSKRRQPTFISDNYTSTILVRDADPRQLQTIEELIALYDVPEPADTKSRRINKMFRLQNAKAASVAEAVKDVFRDLLSSNDKALESKDPNARPGSSGGSFLFMPPGEGKSDDKDEPIRFKGLLSIGIDESSNTLIVSSTASLMTTIGAMIEELDRAGTSSSVVQVIKVDDSVDLALIQERLDKLLGSKTPQNGQNPADGQNQNGIPPQKRPNTEATADQGITN